MNDECELNIVLISSGNLVLVSGKGEKLGTQMIMDSPGIEHRRRERNLSRYDGFQIACLGIVDVSGCGKRGAIATLDYWRPRRSLKPGHRRESPPRVRN